MIERFFIELVRDCFSCYYVATNSVAPFTACKHTHNPQFLHSLSFETRRPMYVSNSVDNTKLPDNIDSPGVLGLKPNS